ncbi:MAG: alpha/beta hydrolase [Pseudomonadota bacterium]
MSKVETEDGRIWGYDRYGHSGGKPVLLHHGLIGNSKIGPIWDRLGKENGLEWIVIERPGYGCTPPMAMKKVVDWPRLITPLLRELGIASRFCAVGLSAGAPYTYALAAAMPERVSHIAILSGVPFIQTDGVLEAYPHDGQTAYARYAVAEETTLRAEFGAFCETMLATLPDHPHIEGAVRAILAEDAAGPAREARLQATDWGFDQDAIRCPVDLWHAPEDDMVPFSAASVSALRLSTANWHVQAEPSHFPSDTTLHQMARTLANGDA